MWIVRVMRWVRVRVVVLRAARVLRDFFSLTLVFDGGFGFGDCGVLEPWFGGM